MDVPLLILIDGVWPSLFDTATTTKGTLTVWLSTKKKLSSGVISTDQFKGALALLVLGRRVAGKITKNRDV